jgi:hypothetical protein
MHESVLVFCDSENVRKLGFLFPFKHISLGEEKMALVMEEVSALSLLESLAKKDLLSADEPSQKTKPFWLGAWRLKTFEFRVDKRWILGFV